MTMRTRRQTRRLQEAVSAGTGGQGGGLDSATKLNNDYVANIDSIIKHLKGCSENNKQIQERLEKHRKTLTDFMEEEDLSTRRRPKRWFRSLRPDCIEDDSNVPSKLVEAYERDQYAIANLRPLSATRALSRDIKEDREGVEWAVIEYVKEGIMDSLFNEETGKSSPEVRDKLRQLVDNCDGYNEIEQLATQLNVVVEINWHKVYEILISQSGKDALEWRHCRTPACARALWQHQLAPGINTSEYTRDEDLQLLSLAEAHHCLDWSSIAAELGTNRTPCSCFQRYHRSLDATAVPKTFTREQDEMLLKYAEKHGKGCWNEIAYEMGTNHTPAQLRQRHRLLVSKRHRGIGSMWTAEENKRLMMAVKMLECSGKRNDWALVAELVPNRTNMSCRERYEKVRHDNEGYDQEPWTEEESQLLKALVDEFGPKWSLISQSFVKRSDNFLLRKWNEIADEEDVRRIKEERETKKAVMRGGLIPDERPEILPSDFKRLITDQAEPSASQTDEQQQPQQTQQQPAEQQQQEQQQQQEEQQQPEQPEQPVEPQPKQKQRSSRRRPAAKPRPKKKPRVSKKTGKQDEMVEEAEGNSNEIDKCILNAVACLDNAASIVISNHNKKKKKNSKVS